jgi:hypothetical protein
MNKLMIVLLLIGSISIFAQDYYEPFPIHYSSSFTMRNPSATGRALGITGGGADIWNQNPLDVWSNPAKLGYFEGLSMGYSHDDCSGNYWDEAYFDNSYLTLGWNGIGLMLPMLNHSSKFGSTLYCEMQDLNNDDGVCIGEVESWESSSGFALGVNLLEFYGAIQKQEDCTRLRSFTDLSIGYNYNFINSELTGYSSSEDSIIKLKSHTDGLGIIFRFSPLNGDNSPNFGFINTDLVISKYYRNLSKTKMQYLENTQPIYFSTETAAVIKLGVGIKSIAGSELANVLSTFCKDIISVKYTLGNSHIVDDYWLSGDGIELTLLDLVSFRWGNYKNREKEINGETSGVGLNLRYRDVVQFQYNYAEFPGGDLEDVMEVSEYMLNFNLLKFFE